MTKPYAKLIKAELDWMNDAQEVWGNLLIDPYMIALNRENPGLKRLFTESGLNRKKADHWKLLLARIAAVTYRPKTAGPGRPIELTPKDNHDLLKAALLIRIDDPKSVEKISEDLVDRHKRCKDLTPEYIREKIQ